MPVTFNVPSAGTYTIEIGAREDGFRIDAFAFGSVDTYFSETDLNEAVGDPEVDVFYAISPSVGDLVQIDRDIVVTATNGAVTLSSVLDHFEMLLIADGVTNDVSSAIVSSENLHGMTFAYTNDLESVTDYTVVVNIYRTDGVTDSTGVSFSTTQTSYILLSGTSETDDQNLINFLNNNFDNVNLIYGDFSDFATHSNLIVNSDLFMVSREISSAAYANLANSTAFNALTIPVVAFSSYVTRPADSRWGWHSGDVGDATIDGNETTVTNAGTAVFGVTEGAYDWFPGGGTFSRPGTGDLGGGELLATISGPGNILAAHWTADDYSTYGTQFGGERLLFNLNQVNSMTVLPSDLGEIALIKALSSYTPLEPSVEYIAVESPLDGEIQVSVDADIVVTFSDVGINWSSLIDSYEMRVNSSAVSASSSTENGVTTFTYSPPQGFNYSTSYDIQLDVIRTDGKTDTVQYSFSTEPESYLLEVIVSGTSDIGDQALIDFLHNNFQGPIKVTYGDYSNFAAHSNAIANADIFMTGRNITSSAYDNAENSAGFNALPIPVVAFSSYIARNAGARWGWHSGDVVETTSVAGTETTVTEAGAGIFGVATGTYDWYDGTDVLNAAGAGTTGSGEILAAIGPDIVAAHWNAGDLTATGITMGGERLLFNLNKYSTTPTIMPSGDGAAALVKALAAYTPLQALSMGAPDLTISTEAPDTVTVSCPTENGISYSLQKRSTLTQGSWVTVGTVRGDGSTYSTNVSTSAGTEFFRLEIQ